ncbi:MAG: hydroxyisourate hydrolase [Flavobacteriales bacterium]|nr:hydroxyisourate hydrolase [Flavobacteriales bacterium]
MPTFSTHILDTARAYLPVASVSPCNAPLALMPGTTSPWAAPTPMAASRLRLSSGVVPESASLSAGIYRVRFDVSAYFSEHKTRSFYPYIEVVFELAADAHYHVPLLLSHGGSRRIGELS